MGTAPVPAEPDVAPPQDGETIRNPFRRLYRWILSWAHHPAGTWALGFFAFVDSSVFPVPPLFLQIALSLERPRRSWWYATVNAFASTLGAILGYVIGYALYAAVGEWIIRINGLGPQFNRVGDYFAENAFLFILVWSFIPFPYKLITIGSGVYSDRVGLATLLVASLIGRGARFFLLAAVCWYFGDRARTFIERYFNWVLLGVGALVVAVILAMKLLFAGD